jgi:4-hydroxy-3-methylbut-2-enyl diphosphate reductase
MELILSKYTGFCGGVKRSVDIAHREAREQSQGQVWVDGKLVHNPRVLPRLEDIGVRELGSTLQPCNASDSIIVRAHGVTPARRKTLEGLAHKVIDATCPKVRKTAGLIEKYSADGYHVVLAGDGTHPEIIGLRGQAEEGRISVLSSAVEVDCLKISEANVIVKADFFRRVAPLKKGYQI